MGDRVGLGGPRACVGSQALASQNALQRLPRIRLRSVEDVPLRGARFNYGQLVQVVGWQQAEFHSWIFRERGQGVLLHNAPPMAVGIRAACALDPVGQSVADGQGLTESRRSRKTPRPETPLHAHGGMIAVPGTGVGNLPNYSIQILRYGDQEDYGKRERIRADIIHPAMERVISAMNADLRSQI
jgi:hypothetical protein